VFLCRSEMTQVLELLLSRPRVLIASGLALIVSVLVVHPTWAQALGVDVWTVPELKEQVRASSAEGDRLADEDEDVLRRIAIKEGIVSDLIAGRSTLAEASERFTVLNAARPEYANAVRDAFPGATDQEKTSRNVISYALTRVAPHARAALSSRLEAELRQTLDAGATN
jgi:hypothetical protein